MKLRLPQVRPLTRRTSQSSRPGHILSARGLSVTSSSRYGTIEAPDHLAADCTPTNPVSCCFARRRQQNAATRGSGAYVSNGLTSTDLPGMCLGFQSVQVSTRCSVCWHAGLKPVLLHHLRVMSMAHLVPRLNPRNRVLQQLLSHIVALPVC